MVTDGEFQIKRIKFKILTVFIALHFTQTKWII